MADAADVHVIWFWWVRARRRATFCEGIIACIFIITIPRTQESQTSASEATCFVAVRRSPVARKTDVVPGFVQGGGGIWIPRVSNFGLFTLVLRRVLLTTAIGAARTADNDDYCRLSPRHHHCPWDGTNCQSQAHPDHLLPFGNRMIDVNAANAGLISVSTLEAQLMMALL